jgi:hypothetical protein
LSAADLSKEIDNHGEWSMVLVVITTPGISDFSRAWLKRHSAAATRVCRTARDTVGHIFEDGFRQPAVLAAEAVDLMDKSVNFLS